jgi:hypothetical protein
MSCLFDSLSRFVPDESINGQTLRHIICNFLHTNPMLIDDMNAETVIKEENGMPLEQYVANMRNSGTYGGAIEIRAFTRLFKLNVLVKSLPNRKNIEFIENPKFLWSVITWNGGHYEAVEK